MNEYVRITFTASRDMGDEETLPTTDEDIARTLAYEDCGKLDRILWAIYTVEVEDITEAEAWLLVRREGFSAGELRDE